MDVKDIQYLVEGLSSTLAEFYSELHEALVAKGRKRMGQEDAPDSPQVSELIRRTRERQVVADLVGTGKKGEEELIQAVGAQVKRILSSAGIVTHSDLARVEKRMDEIEKALADKGY
jgi:polyhydroxyalkanoate synthesis regulator phasin